MLGRIRNRVVLYDPVAEMVYTRTLRKNSAGYKYDPKLQDILLEEGPEALRRVARLYFGGYVEQVRPELWQD